MQNLKMITAFVVPLVIGVLMMSIAEAELHGFNYQVIYNIGFLITFSGLFLPFHFAKK